MECVWYLYFPEDGAGVAVVVVPERNVLHTFIPLGQVRLYMLEEPRLEPPSDLIQLRKKRDVILSVRGRS